MEMKGAPAASSGASHYLDALVLARRAFSFRSYSLDSLTKQLEIERGRAHRADSDVGGHARGVRQVRRAPRAHERARSVGSPHRRAAGARGRGESACEAAVEHGLPVRVVYRPSKRGPQDLEMVLTEVRSDLDPPKVMGYQLPGRGRRELRADRVLRVDPSSGT